MREILFRGKSVNDGNWVEGSLVITTIEPVDDTPIKHYHIENMTIGAFPNEFISGLSETVNPNTVGQFTGLTDKNGKRIFEGDIFNLEDEIMAVVIFKDGCFRLEEYGLRGTWTESGFDECGGSWGVIDCDPIDWYSLYAAEIIGNIHDNPEFLEVPDGQA